MIRPDSTVSANDRLSVMMALAFYPRGGSAQVARYLANALLQLGDSLTLLVGSLGPVGVDTNAETFFDGIPVESLDFTPAVEEFDRGGDPMLLDVPMHPSFEDRSGAPDRIFAALDDEAARRQIQAWAALVGRHQAPDIFHLHHLTHINEAVLVHDEVPVVVHLHGTELKMLEAIRADGVAAWPHAQAWRQRLVAGAHRADRFISISPSDRDLAVELLGISPALTEVIPNGVDLTRFQPEHLEGAERLMHWTRWLVEDPRGWEESGRAGSIAYTVDQVETGFRDPDSGAPLPVLLFVGRFLDFKRVPLLIRAYARARESLGASPSPLVIWGGHLGEWEGEHPHTVASQLGVEGVFFAGWRGHDDLKVALNCADILVAPSVGEPFGQVYLEAMASGLAVIGTQSGGPPSFINTNPQQLDGWLVQPDSESALTAAIIEAAGNLAESHRRGRNGRAVVEGKFDWLKIGQRVDALYRDVLGLA